MLKHTFVVLAATALLSLATAGCNKHGKKLKFDSCEVYYKDGADKATATAVGEYLKKLGLCTGHKKSFQVKKPDDKLIFRMVVKSGYDKNKSFLSKMKLFAFGLSKEVVKGKPVVLHLCDKHFKTLLEIPWSGKEKGVEKKPKEEKSPKKGKPAKAKEKKAPAKKK